VREKGRGVSLRVESLASDSRPSSLAPHACFLLAPSPPISHNHILTRINVNLRSEGNL
jgi:hypothetical protein